MKYFEIYKGTRGTILPLFGMPEYDLEIATVMIIIKKDIENLEIEISTVFVSTVSFVSVTTDQHCSIVVSLTNYTPKKIPMNNIGEHFAPTCAALYKRQLS